MKSENCQLKLICLAANLFRSGKTHLPTTSISAMASIVTSNSLSSVTKCSKLQAWAIQLQPLVGSITTRRKCLKTDMHIEMNKRVSHIGIGKRVSVWMVNTDTDQTLNTCLLQCGQSLPKKRTNSFWEVVKGGRHILNNQTEVNS